MAFRACHDAMDLAMDVAQPATACFCTANKGTPAAHFAQGTEQQLWAARELKAQNSRYHTAYRAWFNRASEPRVRADLRSQPVPDCALAVILTPERSPRISIHGLLD